MNEQIVQKIREAYEKSSLGEWKLQKTQEGQLKIMLRDMVVAIVNRLEDAVFIENMHRYLPGLLSTIRTPEEVKKVEQVESKRTKPPKQRVEIDLTKMDSEPQVLVPKAVPKGVDIPTLEVPKAGSLTELS